MLSLRRSSIGYWDSQSDIMRIKFSISLEISRRGVKDVTNVKEEAPEVLEHSGSTTEIRSQPTYLGFAIPDEEN